MIIRGVETWTEQLALTRPYIIATRQVNAVDLHFVLLKSDSGMFGLGCAAPTEVTSEDPPESLEVLHSAASEFLKGQDPRPLRPLTHELRACYSKYPSSLAALDMALYDLVARSYGISVAALIGKSILPLPTSITIGILSPDETIAEAHEYLARGFRCLKVKLGLDFEEDLERLRLLRSTLSPSIHIRVDANQGYSIRQIEEFVYEVQSLNLELIEQPLPRGCEHEMLQLPKEYRSQMAADESMHDPQDALRLTPNRPFGIWNIKLMKSGGITGALQIADLATLTGIDLMWGCMDESVISISAALHTALACPRTRYLDLDGSLDLSRDTALGGFQLVDGYLYPLDEPGLGVHLAH